MVDAAPSEDNTTITFSCDNDFEMDTGLDVGSTVSLEGITSKSPPFYREEYAGAAEIKGRERLLWMFSMNIGMLQRGKRTCIIHLLQKRNGNFHSGFYHLT